MWITLGSVNLMSAILHVYFGWKSDWDFVIWYASHHTKMIPQKKRKTYTRNLIYLHLRKKYYWNATIICFIAKRRIVKKSADGIYSHRRLFAVGLLVILLPVVVIFRVLNFFLDSLQTLVTNVYIFGYLLGEFTYQDQRNCKPAAPLTNMG